MLKTKNSKLKTPQTISVIGGGSGTSTVLKGLQGRGYKLNAIVSTIDDGGSTGVLRRELGVMPPGDLRNCLVALAGKSKTGQILHDLFIYRFSEGGLKGHNLGNLIIAALEKMRGGLKPALKELHQLFNIEDAIIPVTFDNTHLIAKLKDGSIIKGEGVIYESDFSKNPVVALALSSKARINPDAQKAILKSDLIIIGPGDLYCSIIPNLLVKGVKEAIRASKAKKIFMVNLMNKRNQLDGFTITDYIRTIERYTYKNIFDTVLYNTNIPPASLLKKYQAEGTPVPLPRESAAILKGYDLLALAPAKKAKGDPFLRFLIRHDPEKIARALANMIAKA